MENSGNSFNIKSSIPDLSGKVILITGGNNGLGYQTVLALASHNPSKIYVAARSPEKAIAAMKSIKDAVPQAPLEFLEFDLSSLRSVAAAAKKFVSESSRLDLLFLNAGIMAMPPARTSDGYETQFGTNHMGHALLTKLLMPTLLRTSKELGSDVRIIVLSSASHKFAPSGGIVFPDLKSTQERISTWARYGQSKTANILFTRELARRYPSIISVVVHPGIVATNLLTTATQNSFLIRTLRSAIGGLMSKTPEEGVRNQLWAATAKKGEVLSGEYYEPVGKTGGASKDSINPKLAGELWEWTEKELDGYSI